MRLGLGSWLSVLGAVSFACGARSELSVLDEAAAGAQRVSGGVAGGGSGARAAQGGASTRPPPLSAGTSGSTGGSATPEGGAPSPAGSGGTSAGAGGAIEELGGSGGIVAAVVELPTCQAAPTFDAVRAATQIGGMLGAWTAGDWNGDGKRDLAFVGDRASTGSDFSLRVLLGKGDGTFAVKVVGSILNDDVQWLGAGDWDGDGKLDLAASTWGRPGLSVLFGNGDGTFEPGGEYGPGASLDSAPIDRAVGDFDADGRADLAVTNQTLSGVGGPSLSVLLGQADRTFRTLADAPLTTAYLSPALTAGDLNEDGKVDLVISNGDATVFLGAGDGTFTVGSTYSTPDSVDGAILRDFDKDGHLDLLAANRCEKHATQGSVFLGNGDGTFRAGIESGWGCGLPRVADVDEDGTLDLVLFSGSVYRGKGDGTFERSSELPDAGVLEDWTGDGKLDWASVSYDHWLYVLPGNGDGTFGDSSSYPAGASAPYAVALRDLNGDAALDIATTNESALSVLLATGPGTFGARTEHATGSPPQELRFADLDRNGKTDIVTVSSSAVGEQNPVSVLFGRAEGGYEPRTQLQVGSQGTAAQTLALGDLSGDERPDLVAADGTFLRVALGNGDGSFAPTQDYGLPRAATSLALGDLNDDGALDVVAALPGADESSLVVFIGVGDGTFAREVRYSTGAFAGGVTLADLNRDGALDVLVSQYEALGVLLGVGDGTFGERVDFVPAAGGLSAELAVGDLNQDGALDVAMSGYVLGVLLGTGDGRFSCSRGYVNPADSLALGDLNGDARVDVVTRGAYGIRVLLNSE